MAALTREVERAVDSAEMRAYLEQPVSEDERQAVLALVRWFRRRYPTPAARLAYVRQAYARWCRTNGGPYRG
jgi:hypothetical protein